MPVRGRDALIRLVRAGTTTAVIDYAFSSVLVTVFYHSTFARLWQGVASVPFGPSMMDGGPRTVLIGTALHICVAFFWSSVFLLFYLNSARLRGLIETPGGLVGVAVLYGPCIWLIMSFIVIQSFTHRPPVISFRWWVQFFGHIPFVAMPIIIGIRGIRPMRGA